MTVALLSLLVPTKITDAMLISSTAVEPAAGEVAWVPGNNYALKDRVYRSTTHMIYENLIPGIDSGLPENNPTRWEEVRPTNRWAVFDDKVSTQTVLSSPFTMVLKPGFFNAIAFFGLDGAHITVTVKDNPGGNQIFQYDGALENSMPSDYYEHWFSPYKPQTDLILSGIEPYLNAELTITITSAGSVACGIIAIGDLKPLGKTLRGAKAAPKTFSYIDIDKFGNNKIVRRKSAKDLTLTALVAIEEANSVLDTLTDLMDVPCCLIGAEGSEYSGVRGYGLVKGDLAYDEARTCTLSINLQGLI